MMENQSIQSLLEKAIFIALNSHKGQLDKAGEAYILHPLRVMLALKTSEEQLVGILHDTLEDSGLTIEKLKAYSFPDQVCEALLVLTRKDNEPYETYIQRIKSNELARNVKLADLADNMNMARIPNFTAKDVERLARYEMAMKILT